MIYLNENLEDALKMASNIPSREKAENMYSVEFVADVEKHCTMDHFEEYPDFESRENLVGNFGLKIEDINKAVVLLQK